MEAIRKLFRLSEQVQPSWGAYIHLCRALRGTNTKRPQIQKLFNELMPREEYDKPDKKELIDYLVSQSSIQNKGISNTD